MKIKVNVQIFREVVLNYYEIRTIFNLPFKDSEFMVSTPIFDDGYIEIWKRSHTINKWSVSISEQEFRQAFFMFKDEKLAEVSYQPSNCYRFIFTSSHKNIAEIDAYLNNLRQQKSFLKRFCNNYNPKRLYYNNNEDLKKCMNKNGLQNKN